MPLFRRERSGFEALFLNHPQPMWIYDPTTLRLVDVNDAALAVFGYDRAAFLRLGVPDIVSVEDAARARETVAELARSRARTSGLWRTRRADGSTFYADITSTVHESGRRRLRIATAADATSRLAVSRALSQSRSSLAEAQQLAHLGSYETDLVTGEIRWSSELFRIFGVDAASTRPTVVTDYDHPADAAAVAVEVARARDERRPYASEHRIVRPDGTERFVFERGQFVFEGGDDEPTRVIGAILDITERKLAEEQLRRLAEHDVLTGLPNRTLLGARLVAALETARATDTLAAVLFIDLDRFKSINDTLAHAAGDHLLRALARRLLGVMDAHATVARPGGDEFTVVVGGLADADGALAVARRILEAIAVEVPYEGTNLVTTASIGVAMFPYDGTTPDELLRSADTAMYVAKGRGGNAVELYAPELHARNVRAVAMEGALRRALERDEIALAYQPIVHAWTGETVAVEALARWTLDGTPVSPGEFIPLAESTGLIIPLGTRVLRVACREARRIADRGRALTVCVNISARQFREPGFAALVRASLEEYGLAPSALQLEVTESAYISADASAHTVRALERLGVGLSIDDFGTGYSSLGYLKRLPVDALKIDRSFVDDILVDPADQAIVRAIIAVAHNLGLATVAEGVETIEQVEFLQLLGCTRLQGFFFARALPPAELDAYLARPSAIARGSHAV